MELPVVLALLTMVMFCSVLATSTREDTITGLQTSRGITLPLLPPHGVQFQLSDTCRPDVTTPVDWA